MQDEYQTKETERTKNRRAELLEEVLYQPAESITIPEDGNSKFLEEKNIDNEAARSEPLEATQYKSKGLAIPSKKKRAEESQSVSFDGNKVEPTKPNDSEKKEKPLAPKAKGPDMLPYWKYHTMYKYETGQTKCLMVVGVLSSFLGGFIFPAYGIVLGFIATIYNPAITNEEREDIMWKFLVFAFTLAFFSWFLGYLQFACLQAAAERLSFNLRGKYLNALMQQEIKYFEKQQVEALPSLISEYFFHLSDGLGEKFGQFMNALGMIVGGNIIALCRGWALALILVCYLPVFLILVYGVRRAVSSSMIEKFAQGTKLGSHTEETLSALKLVVAFANEDHHIQEYRKVAIKTKGLAQYAAVTAGCYGGLFFGAAMGFSLFSWFIGGLLIINQVNNPVTGSPYNVIDVIIVYQAELYGLVTFASMLPIMPAINRAFVVGKKIFELIDRVPEICTPNDPDQICHNIDIQDGIHFSDVHFRYPTAPEGQPDVFQGVNFTIKSGTSTAIVGPSGSGKSTIVQLLNRFYDPDQGHIKYGKDDLIKFELDELRHKIGWVGQEPVLILGTIRENLQYGNLDATEDDMNDVLKRANAAKFISEQEKGLDTYVGSGSILNLSGGQKQRVAIARALIKNPQILVLDEATSALDSKSEAEVQGAISRIQSESKDLTVIMIAHRLQTIQTADNLLYLESPTNVLSATKGTAEYNELMARLMKTNYAHQDEQAKKTIRTLLAAPSIELSENLLLGHDKTRLEKDVIAAKKKLEKVAEITPEEEVHQPDAFVSTNAGWKRLFGYYKPKWATIIMLFAGILQSFTFPLLGYILATLQFIYYGGEDDPEGDWVEEKNKTLVHFVYLLFFIVFIFSLNQGIFGFLGEKLTCELRIELFTETMHKQISWFDRQERAPGILTSVFSENIEAVRGMTSETLVKISESIFAFAIGTAVGIYLCPPQAVVLTLLCPVMVVSMFLWNRLQWKKSEKGSEQTKDSVADAYDKSNALLSDLVLNYRTVIGFGQKNIQQINQKYTDLLLKPMNAKVKEANSSGIAFGFSQSGRIIFLGGAFYLGFVLTVQKFGYSAEEVFKGTFIPFFAYMGVGLAISNVPSVMNAKNKAKPIFSYIDDKSTLDSRMIDESRLSTVAQGHIEFKDVCFNYPSKNQLVLDQMNIDIPTAAKIALVGHSGCGKSTITNLLLRFYNLKSGQIIIDGHSIEEYNVHHLRKEIGFVMQEPILFNWSIKDNIKYGKQDATDEEVYKAAQTANAIDFIENSNTKALTNEEQREKMNQRLRVKLDSLQKDYSAIFELKSELKERSDKQRDLVLEIFDHGDKSLLTLINADSAKFMDLIDSDGAKDGAKWDDMIIEFEWQYKFNAMLTKCKSQTAVKEVLVEAGDKMKFCFSETMVADYIVKLDTDQPAFSSFEQYVNENFKTYQKEKLHRIDQLIDNLINTMRDWDGKFKLSEGFDRQCGLKGSKLSGGQKQRIAIARALIKNPSILILDEATSALDEQSQEIVQQALDRSMEGRTSIVIAHRLSTIRNCDLLFVLDKGKVAEQGSYDELSADPHSHFSKLKAGMEM